MKLKFTSIKDNLDLDLSTVYQSISSATSYKGVRGLVRHHPRFMIHMKLKSCFFNVKGYINET